jgi:hypothetical protein
MWRLTAHDFTARKEPRMIARAPRGELGKPAAGAIFVLFWLIAIAAWIVAGVALGDAGAWQPFLVDVGLLFASIGFAAPFLGSTRAFAWTLVFGVVGVILFAIGEFADITPIVYFVRLLAPFLGVVIAPTFKLVNGVKVFA